jgi:uncharacterized SAM-binding protein YcdF (DUF218 family)
MGRPLLSLAILLVGIAYGFGIWLFLLRPDDPLPARADAVFVLAGSRARLPVALRLVNRGVARALVVSTDDPRRDPRRFELCHGRPPKRYTLVCRRAAPFSTRGESRLIASLARRRGWRTVVVVSSRYHLFRAHILLRRCTPTRLVLRGADGDTWWRKAIAIPLEYAKLGRAEVVQRDC